MSSLCSPHLLSRFHPRLSLNSLPSFLQVFPASFSSWLSILKIVTCLLSKLFQSYLQVSSRHFPKLFSVPSLSFLRPFSFFFLVYRGFFSIPPLIFLISSLSSFRLFFMNFHVFSSSFPRPFSDIFLFHVSTPRFFPALLQVHPCLFPKFLPVSSLRLLQIYSKWMQVPGAGLSGCPICYSKPVFLEQSRFIS